ncbi:hypothetical protein [Mycobacterium sp. NPDC006124]|uniref:hypothetical protein n=1 Tax=Mycobacterium sp. NPDC006124 TaxID=3156729 RepID=UPI00339F3B40
MAAVRVLWWFGLACWSVAALWHFLRPPSLWLLDVVVQPLSVVLYVFGFGAVIVALVAQRRRTALLTVVPVMIVVTALVNPGWQVAPRAWFAMHRPLFDMALATQPGESYYGNALPLHLRFLSSGGRVSDQDGSRFFPQWIGVPDDAGGYLYDPIRSPVGADLYGSSCRNPVDLGGGWWMCGLADTGW